MAFETWKAARSAAWDSAPFEPAADTLTEIHERLLALLQPVPGERWLDVAAGTGRIALAAAERGAEVAGVDFAPALLATARELAASRRLEVRFDVGDCERLPYPDRSFDVVVSSMGAIFAPDHVAVARELARVCRPAGRLGITAWRPDEDFGTAVGDFYAPLPEGAGVSEDWGREDYVTDLLGDAFDLEFLAGDSPLIAESGEAIWELYVTSVGTLKATAEALDPDRREAFHRAYVNHLEGFRTNGQVRFPREYLITIGRRKETHA